MNSIMGLVREDLGVGGVMRAPYTAAVRAGTGEQFRDNLIQSYARSAGLDIAPRSGAAPPPPEGMEIDRRQ
jgi:hypothetical protein